MPRTQKNANFIDKSFTVVANILVACLPTTAREKQAFQLYREGLSAQTEGEYAESLNYYLQALRLEVDAYDRSFILYNIGLIHTANGKHTKALEYYFQALEVNSSFPQALNNIGIIFHFRGEKALEVGNTSQADLLFRRAATFWAEAVRLAPMNYSEVQNWLKHSKWKSVPSLR